MVSTGLKHLEIMRKQSYQHLKALYIYITCSFEAHVSDTKMTFQYFEIIKIYVSNIYYHFLSVVSFGSRTTRMSKKRLDHKIDFQNTFLHTKCTNSIYGSFGSTIILEVRKMTIPQDLMVELVTTSSTNRFESKLYMFYNIVRGMVPAINAEEGVSICETRNVDFRTVYRTPMFVKRHEHDLSIIKGTQPRLKYKNCSIYTDTNCSLHFNNRRLVITKSIVFC